MNTGFTKKGLFTGLLAAMVLLCSCSTAEQVPEKEATLLEPQEKIVTEELSTKQPPQMLTLDERIEKAAEYQGIEPHSLPEPDYPEGFVRGHMPDCPKAEMVELPTEYRKWNISGFIACQHGDPFKKDVEQQRILYKMKECKNCGYTETEAFIETRIAHI